MRAATKTYFGRNLVGRDDLIAIGTDLDDVPAWIAKVNEDTTAMK